MQDAAQKTSTPPVRMHLIRRRIQGSLATSQALPTLSLRHTTIPWTGHRKHIHKSEDHLIIRTHLNFYWDGFKICVY